MPFSIFGKKKQTKPPADKEGILFIEKSNGKFSSKKWFELRNTILSMHKSKEKNNKTIKQIELVQYETRIIDIENYKNNSHTFGVKPAGEDTVWLAAPDEEERSQWIQYLKDIVQPDAKYNIPDEILKHLKNEKGHHEIIQQIKDDKFDMNKRHRARHNNSLLMLAVESNHFPLVRELVDINADIDMKNDHGNTALLLACSLGYHKIVSKLLSRADKTVTDPRGRNGLFLAVEFERWDVALSLVDDPDIDANAKDIQTGRTVLHHAVAKNNMECIFKLVNERHVKVDIVDYKGYTPADYAAMQDLTPIVTLLLENGSRLPIDEDRDAQDEVEGEVEDEEKSNNNQNNKNTDDSKDGEIESENQDKNQDENNEEKEKEQTENRGEEKTENKDSEDKNDDQSETKNKEDQGEDKSENHHEIQEQEKEEDAEEKDKEKEEEKYDEKEEKDPDKEKIEEEKIHSREKQENSSNEKSEDTNKNNDDQEQVKKESNEASSNTSKENADRQNHQEEKKPKKPKKHKKSFLNRLRKDKSKPSSSSNHKDDQKDKEEKKDNKAESSKPGSSNDDENNKSEEKQNENKTMNNNNNNENNDNNDNNENVNNNNNNNNNSSTQQQENQVIPFSIEKAQAKRKENKSKLIRKYIFPLIRAARNQDLRSIFERSSEHDVSVAGAINFGLTPLQYAVMFAPKGEKRCSVVKTLLDLDSPIDSVWLASKSHNCNTKEELHKDLDLLSDADILSQSKKSDETTTTATTATTTTTTANKFTEQEETSLMHKAKIDHCTALHIAVVSEDKDVVDLLIEAGADIDAVTDTGKTPLMLAAHLANTAIGKHSLLAHGADFTLQDKHGSTALHFASFAGCVELVEFFMEREMDPDLADKQGRTPLALAAEKGHGDTVSLLLDYNANPFGSGKEMDVLPPLHSAVKSGNQSIVKYMIEHKEVPVDQKAHIEQSILEPIHVAALYGQTEMVDCLLLQGADLQCKTRFMGEEESSILHVAAYSGFVDTMEHMLQRGAALNARNAASCLPLHFAFRGKNVNMISELLSYGSETDEKAMQLAIGMNNSRILALLSGEPCMSPGLRSDDATSATNFTPNPNSKVFDDDDDDEEDNNNNNNNNNNSNDNNTDKVEVDQENNDEKKTNSKDKNISSNDEPKNHDDHNSKEKDNANANGSTSENEEVNEKIKDSNEQSEEDSKETKNESEQKEEEEEKIVELTPADDDDLEDDDEDDDDEEEEKEKEKEKDKEVDQKEEEKKELN